MAKAVAFQVSEINYDNFKNSISKDEYQRHDAYLQVWGNFKDPSRLDITNLII